MKSSIIQRDTHAIAAFDGADRDLLSLYLLRYDRKTTQKAYRGDISGFFGTPEVTLSQAADVTFVDVNEYVLRLQDAGYKATTIKRRIAALRGFYEWLVALKAIESNPAHRQLLRRIRTSRQSDKSILFLSAEQANKLLETAAKSGKASMRNRVLLLTLLHCVLRRSEAAAMNVEHVRPLGHYWVLDLPETKGGADEYVKIPAHVVEAIDEMKSHYGIVSGPLWRSLSSNNRDRRLTAHSIYRIVRETAVAAGLPDIGAHTLRHTGCTLAIEAGASLQQVQSHARHKHIETTMIYVHQRDRLRDSAADYIRLKKS